MSEKNECPIPAGVLLIVGGKEKKDEMLKHFVGLIPKKYANIQVVTSGSGESGEMFAEYKRAFNELGHTAIGEIHHDVRKDVLEDKALLTKMAEADGFFFAGGDQLMLTSLYGGTEFLTRLKERYIAEPIVIGGTSAGAMAMSTPMIYAGNEEEQEVSGEIKVTTGLEFLRDVCIDTHFVHRSRFVRLAQVIATNPGCTGIGIEENTAIVVRSGREAEIVGTGTVILILGFFIAESNMENFTEKRPVSIRNLKVDILAPGDRFCIEQPNPPHQ